jgi:transcriptional regulator of acetoin/glycerol metabolism
MPSTLELRQALEEAIERETRQALNDAGGSITKAAALLGLTRATVHRRMGKYGIEIQRIVNEAA